MTIFKVTALRGDHPLGFLAACGLLRCCHEWADFGSVKLAWVVDSGQFVAVLHSATALDIKALTQMLNCRRKQQRQSAAFTRSTKIDDRKEFRKTGKDLLAGAQRPCDRDPFDTLSSFASDVVTTNRGKLRPTLFSMTSGQQSLIKSILGGAARPFTEDAIREALIGPWQYQDGEHALGWDPQTQRLHALRHKVPASDTANRSVRAAVFLASQALPLFPCFAVNARLRTTGFHRQDGEDWFSWPIWRQPISLNTLRSLLALPFGRDLQRRGVEIVYHCRRASTGGGKGDYRVFSHAEQRPWPKRSKHRHPIEVE
jgi:hypothetical protein